MPYFLHFGLFSCLNPSSECQWLLCSKRRKGLLISLIHFMTHSFLHILIFLIVKNLDFSEETWYKRKTLLQAFFFFLISYLSWKKNVIWIFLTMIGVQQRLLDKIPGFHLLRIYALCEMYYLACMMANRHFACYKLILYLFPTLIVFVFNCLVMYKAGICLTRL